MKKKNLFIVLSIFLSLSSYAQYGVDSSQSEAQFCHDRQDIEFYQQLLLKRNNRLSFRNDGGLLDLGVCWWHSRFTRNAAYLTYYAPNKAKPTENEARRLITQIRGGGQVIEIPGYENLREFSMDWQHLIQRSLNQWQLIDGIVQQHWVKGLSGPVRLPPVLMKNLMDQSYDLVKNQKNILFHKLQLPGIPAHSWLVVDMTKTNQGYDLKVVDSNYSGLRTFQYHDGDDSVYTSSYDHFVPYIDIENVIEEQRLRAVVNHHCR